MVDLGGESFFLVFFFPFNPRFFPSAFARLNVLSCLINDMTFISLLSRPSFSLDFHLHFIITDEI